jgi:hypothetical protein
MPAWPHSFAQIACNRLELLHPTYTYRHDTTTMWLRSVC